MSECLFCILKDQVEVFDENDYFYCIYDKFPVSKGHLLIIPKRHINDYFDLYEDEISSMYKFMHRQKESLDVIYKPDGYNIGVNNGKAAGQTIMHLHIHLIPRYLGDFKNPEGGVRGVIPSKQKY
jgi:diadenosine tetraphosphate (Ap4A) HIT family hydrolase